MRNLKNQEKNNTRIFYFCADAKEPMGGNRSNYRVVDFLNRNGYEAYAVHIKKGFRCEWFQNNTNVAYLEDLKFTKKDYVVLPEYSVLGMLDFSKLADKYGQHILNLKKNIVIENRACYRTFDYYPILDEVSNVPYLSPDLLGVIVVSEDSKNYLQYVFPGIKIFRVRNSINPDIFKYNPNKTRKICFMLRRNKLQIIQVINILRYMNMLKDFELVPIENKSLEETAKIMNESLIFLSFSNQEGFGNPPAEAMLCGCIVIGFHGRGGREYFNPEFSYPIEEGDIIGFVKAIEEVIKKYNADTDYFKTFTKKGADYIKENYSKEKEESEVIKCWKSLLEIHP